MNSPPASAHWVEEAVAAVSAGVSAGVGAPLAVPVATLPTVLVVAGWLVAVGAWAGLGVWAGLTAVAGDGLLPAAWTTLAGRPLLGPQATRSAARPANKATKRPHLRFM